MLKNLLKIKNGLSKDIRFKNRNILLIKNISFKEKSRYRKSFKKIYVTYESPEITYLNKGAKLFELSKQRRSEEKKILV